MDAARYGIRITLIEDCLGFRQKSRHEEAIRQLVDIMGVDVMTSEKVVDILRNPPDPAADTEDEEEDDDNIPPFPRQPVPQETITSSRDALPVDLSSALAVDSDPDQEGEEEEDGEEGEDGEDMSPPQVRASHSSSAHLPLRFKALLRTHSRRAAAVRPTTAQSLRHSWVPIPARSNGPLPLAWRRLALESRLPRALEVPREAGPRDVGQHSPCRAWREILQVERRQSSRRGVVTF